MNSRRFTNVPNPDRVATFIQIRADYNDADHCPSITTAWNLRVCYCPWSRLITNRLPTMKR
jgi:hypothetical protein